LPRIEGDRQKLNPESSGLETAALILSLA